VKRVRVIYLRVHGLSDHGSICLAEKINVLVLTNLSARDIACSYDHPCSRGLVFLKKVSRSRRWRLLLHCHVGALLSPGTRGTVQCSAAVQESHEERSQVSHPESAACQKPNHAVAPSLHTVTQCTRSPDPSNK
jgi:hypothetical protein